MIDFEKNNCVCCGGKKSKKITTSSLDLTRCDSCATVYGKHLEQVKGRDAWKSSGVTPEFLQALKNRRLIQANSIYFKFYEALNHKKILDYGAGQGLFTSYLRSKNLNAVGCDLSSESARQDSSGTFISLKKPWEVPENVEFDTVTLLDVLEHCDDIQCFLNDLEKLKSKYLIVKVPLSDGPGFLTAMGLLNFKKEKFLNGLFLVGDIAPHVIYFSTKGLLKLFEKNGYHLIKKLNLTEMGKELPDRVRNKKLSFVERKFLTVIGAGAELGAQVWPDTAAFLFKK